MHLIIFFALCAAFCGRVVAQDEVTVAEANRIFVTAGSPEKFVKFSATVIQSVPQEHYVFVQDGRAGTMVILPKDMPVPALRDRIEVEAKVKFVGVALALSLGWVWLTRRSVAKRTAQLAAANARLDTALHAERELGELKTRFVSLVSHEFRTPLGVTMSAVELLRHYAERLLDELRSATKEKCRVVFETEGDLSGAKGDEALLRHIFTNLLSNAVKYSPAGGLVDFHIAREGDTARCTIRDRGIGIPENARASLFQAFHRAGNVGEIPGTGLGLVILKRSVELHGGIVTFDSAVGEGTTFTVRLPLFRG